MNEKAKEIGMKNTYFNNPTGLDEDTKNYSTAYDMALLMRYANSNKLFKKIVSTKRYKLNTNKNSYSWKNKNKLLFTYKYTTGGKTGFTKKARRTLVTSASKKGLKLIVVTLNDPEDFLDHKRFYEYGFDNYEYYKIFDKDKINIKNIYALDDYYYPITRKEKEIISIDYKIKNKKSGGFIGYAYIKLGSKLVHKEKLYKKSNKNVY